jgi:hypothetical protein
MFKRAHKMSGPVRAAGDEEMPHWPLAEVPSDLAYDAPHWLEVEVGRRFTRPRTPPPPRRPLAPAFGPPELLGRNLKLQVKHGYHAVIKELEPGSDVFIVTTAPARTEYGIVPLIAPALLNLLTRTLGPVIDAAQRKKQAKDAAEAQETAPVGGSACRGRCGR